MIALVLVALFGIAVFSGRIEMFNNILEKEVELVKNPIDKEIV